MKLITAVSLSSGPLSQVKLKTIDDDEWSRLESLIGPRSSASAFHLIPGWKNLIKSATLKTLVRSILICRAQRWNVRVHLRTTTSPITTREERLDS